jgi:nucleoside-diphosphate-sugar epimerase
MKILVIGAAGRLGTKVVEQLEERGEHTLRLGDIREMQTEHEFVYCDILDPDKLLPAMEDMDVVYAGFVGRVRPSSDTPADRLRASSRFFEILTIGAFNVLQGAALVDVPKVVLVTSEAARGQRIPITFTEVCDEDTPAKPDYVYALGKYIKEIIAEYTTRIDGVRTLCLRNAWFANPGERRTLQQLGTTLLYQRSVTRHDMARAAVLAIENMDESIQHEVFLLSNKTEFTAEEVPALRTHPETVVERHYPGVLALFEEYGIDWEKLVESKNLWKLDDISKAKRLLGWEPTFTFRDFYEGLKAGKYSRDQIFDI